jgi:hypothetical protein
VFATAAETSDGGEASVPKILDPTENTSSTTSTPPRYSGPLGGHLRISSLWAYYDKFRMAHGLATWSNPSVPEIAVKSGSIVSVPFYLIPPPGDILTVTISADIPDGWKVVGGEGALRLDSSYPNDLRVDVQTPELKKEDFKTVQPRQVVVRASSGGKTLGEVRLNVLLKASALPQ